MNFNPEFGGERQPIPEGDNFEKWQLAGAEAREILLLDESDRWPPVEGKRGASQEARKFARTSSMLAVEAAARKRTEVKE